MFDLRSSANDLNVRHGCYAVPLTILSSAESTFLWRSPDHSVSGFSSVTAVGSDQLKAETPDMICNLFISDIF